MAALFRIVRTVIACLLLLIFVAILYPTFALAEDWRMPFVVFLPAGVVGAAMLRGVLRERRRVAREEAATREVAVLRLADAERGVLTATQIATRLAWPMETAVATLRAVEDSGVVTSTVTDDGVLVFEFRELIPHPALPRPEPDAHAAIRAPEEKPAR
jgi:small-conductance mechanosensitive channel